MNERYNKEQRLATRKIVIACSVLFIITFILKIIQTGNVWTALIMTSLGYIIISGLVASLLFFVNGPNINWRDN